MPRRFALALLASLLATGTAHAQVGFGTGTIPPRRNLARVNLDMHWYANVPLVGAEKLIELSIDTGMLFAQTNSANFFAMNPETGQLLWQAHLGRVTTNVQPASVNSFAVYVTNSNVLYALDRRSGREMWTKRLQDIPTSPTNASDEVVVVGLDSGKLVAFDAKTGAEKYNIQTGRKISAGPIVANRVIAFASEDGKAYLTRTERAKLIWRFALGQPVVAPISSHGIRDLLIPCTDRNVYCVDLYTGHLHWSFPTGAPVKQEPLVVDDDVYVVNEEGQLSEIDVASGHSRWTVSTQGGRLVSVSKNRVYLETHDDDLMVVDRESGKIIYDALATFQRSGINLRDYTLVPTNRLDDRLYFATRSGLLLCLREIDQPTPRLVRDPKIQPFGFIPPEGLSDPSATKPANPTPDPAAEPPATNP